MTEKTAAVLTIHNADNMTSEGRHEIAKWLRRQASFLVREGDNMSDRFRARYMFREGSGSEDQTGVKKS